MRYIPDIEQVVSDIEQFCADKSISVTEFGQFYFNDSGFMSRLKSEEKPRDPRLSTVCRIYEVMRDAEV